MDSILESIKKLLGIDKDYTAFDTDIIININSAFMILTQIGVGPKEGFIISDDKTKWTEFLGDRQDLEAAKIFVYLKTRLTFDPPQMGYLVDAIKTQMDEQLWRLNVQVETKEEL